MSTAAEFDANVERLKACEHIAEGEEGWETLRNLCPSTAAVATLRERVEELEEELDEARLGPWPEWAEKLLRLLESWGAEYEHDDEINLPDEVRRLYSDLEHVAALYDLDARDGDVGHGGRIARRRIARPRMGIVCG